MKTAKKLIAIVLSVILLVSVCPLGLFTFTASAETVSGSCGTNVTWSYDASTYTLTISGTGAMSSYSMSYNGTYVTDAPWRSYYKAMKSVVINSGVTLIGDYAFSGCTGLTSVTIPDSVIEIGYSAFYGCTELKKVNYSGSITDWCKIVFSSSESNPLYYVHNLYIDDELVTDLIIPDSVTSIGDSAFRGCTGLTSITIPDSVTSIGSYAFNDTAWYNRQPDGLVYAGKVAYRYKGACPSSVIIKDGTLGIAGSAFSGCRGLTSVTIPDSVTTIGNLAFDGCDRLTSVTIPDSVTEIVSGAFSGCTGLTSVTISDSVTTIGGYAFYYCTGLRSVTIPDSVTSIGNHAFEDCIGLTSVTIGDSVTSIGGGAFYGCNNLQYNIYKKSKYLGNENNPYLVLIKAELFASTSFEFANNIKVIYDSAFSGCTGLTAVTIPDSVTTIGDWAFYDCTGLRSVTIGDSVTEIGNSAFSGCTGLKKVNYTGSITDWCKIVFFYSYSNPLYYAHNLYIDDELVTDLIIPDSVTSIGSYAFYGCTGLRSVTIPDSVTEIGYGAFYGCTGLTDVYYMGTRAQKSDIIKYDYNGELRNAAWHYTRLCGENCKAIITDNTLLLQGTGDTDNYKTQASVPWYDFAGSVNRIVIDEGISGIGHYAFNCFSSLKSVVIKNKDITLGRYIFNNDADITVFAQSGGNIEEYCTDNSIDFIDVSTPAPKPELTDVTNQSITVKGNDLCEYSVDKTNWQTGNEFDGLSSATKYSVYARYTATADIYNAVSAPLVVTTDKNTVSAPAKPVCIRNTDTEIILQGNSAYEYSIDGVNWQKSNAFTGLTHRETYSLYQRFAETKTDYASPASAPLVMQLVKKTVSAPAAPNYQSHTENSITLAPNNLYEYSLDGENWQKSSEFTGLSKNTIYKFYQRVAETETRYASAQSKPLIVAIPDKPQIARTTTEKIVVKHIDGFEYCLDDMVWQNSNIFDKLIDNEEYTVYQRLKAVDGEKIYKIVSEPTIALTVVSGNIPGDINGDGSLNNKDLTRLFQYLSDWDVEVDEAALDVNGDGSVNNKDLTRLFQYLSDWDVEIF